jgi:hypothetical protein
VHVPQLAIRLPQPSPTGPQLAPKVAQVCGVQPFPPLSAALVLPPHLLNPPPPQ